MTPQPGLVERLRELLAKHCMPIPECGCLIWDGGLTPTGYAQIDIGGRKVLAHRAAYELSRGPIPRGLVIDHLCRVRSCCNPDHLEVVTPRENTLRGAGPTAHNSAKTHCVRGHPLTPDNLVARALKKGWRACKACKYQAKQRAAKQARSLTNG